MAGCHLTSPVGVAESDSIGFVYILPQQKVKN